MYLKTKRDISIFWGIILLLLVISCEKNADKQNIINPLIDLNYEDTIQNKPFIIDEFTPKGKYYILGRIWGIINYHPAPNLKNLDLFNIEEISRLNATNFKSYLNTILEPIEVNIHAKNIIENKEDSLLKIYTLLNNDWLNDTLYLTPEIALKLKYILFNLNGIPIANSAINQSKSGLIDYSNPDYIIGDQFPDRNLRLVGLFDYWNLIYYHYPYKNLLDNNWDEVLFTSIFAFTNADDKDTYTRAILRLIANLNDNQSVITNPDNLVNLFGSYVPNFRVKKIDGNFYVSSIRSKNITTGGIKIGDKITAVNKVSIHTLDFSLQQYASGGNAISKQREVNKIIFVSKNENNIIDLERNNKKLTLAVKFFNNQVVAKMARIDETDWENKSAVIWYPNNMAYLNLNHIFENNFKINLKEIRASSGYVLDLRGFHNTMVAHKIMDLIFRKYDYEMTNIYPFIEKPGVLKEAKQIIIHKKTSKNNSNRPIVIIVDESTQGHAEFLAESYANVPNVKIIGNITAGSIGEVGHYTFPGNIMVNYTSVGSSYYSNPTSQRIGVKLDSTINYQFSYLIAGKDIMIETAIKILNSNIKH